MAEEVEELEADLKDFSDLAGNFMPIFELEQVEVGAEELQHDSMNRYVEDEQLPVDVQLGAASEPAVLFGVDDVVLEEVVGELQQDVVILLRLLHRGRGDPVLRDGAEVLALLVEHEDLIEVVELFVGQHDAAGQQVHDPQLGRVEVQDGLEDGAEDAERVLLVADEHLQQDLFDPLGGRQLGQPVHQLVVLFPVPERRLGLDHHVHHPLALHPPYRAYPGQREVVQDVLAVELPLIAFGKLVFEEGGDLLELQFEGVLRDLVEDVHRGHDDLLLDGAAHGALAHHPLDLLDLAALVALELHQHAHRSQHLLRPLALLQPLVQLLLVQVELQLPQSGLLGAHALQHVGDGPYLVGVLGAVLLLQQVLPER